MKKIITNKEFCEYYQISKPTASEYRKQGMPYISLSERSIRYDIEKVEQWLEQKSKGGEKCFSEERL